MVIKFLEVKMSCLLDFETLVVYGIIAKNEVNGARQISFEELRNYSEKVINHYDANNTRPLSNNLNHAEAKLFEEKNKDFFEKYGAGFKSFTKYEEAKGYKLKDEVSIEHLKEEKSRFVPFSLKSSLLSTEAKTAFRTTKTESTKNL